MLFAPSEAPLSALWSPIVPPEPVLMVYQIYCSYKCCRLPLPRAMEKGGRSELCLQTSRGRWCALLKVLSMKHGQQTLGAPVKMQISKPRIRSTKAES